MEYEEEMPKSLLACIAITALVCLAVCILVRP